MKLLDGIKILIVDDEPMLCELLSDLFTLQGAVVSVAFGVQDALNAISKSHFNIIFSDVRMPDGDGVVLVQAIPSRIKNDLLIYFCSGYSDLTGEDIMKLGVRAIFQKPFEFDSILSTIARDLKK